MKRSVLLTVSFLLTITLMAQDRNGSAYKAGYVFGRVLAFLLVAGLLIWLSLRLIRKNKKGRY